MTHRNFTITRKETSHVQNFCDVSVNTDIFRIFFNLFNKKLWILRIKNEFFNVLNITKQILIQLMRAMFLLQQPEQDLDTYSVFQFMRSKLDVGNYFTVFPN